MVLDYHSMREQLFKQWKATGLLQRMESVKKVFLEERNALEFDKALSGYSEFLDQYGITEQRE